MGIFTGLFKSRDKPTNSYDSPSYTYFFGRANSGKRVTDRTALQHIAVYACVRVLSEAIAQLPLHVYTCRFLLPLRWLSVPPGTLPCFLFQKLQPLRKSPSIGRSGWRIAFGNSFSPIMEASVFGCSGCVCGSSFSLVLLCLLEMMLLLGRVCFDCRNSFIASP